MDVLLKKLLLTKLIWSTYPILIAPPLTDIIFATEVLLKDNVETFPIYKNPPLVLVRFNLQN